MTAQPRQTIYILDYATCTLLTDPSPPQHHQPTQHRSNQQPHQHINHHNAATMPPQQPHHCRNHNAAAATMPQKPQCHSKHNSSATSNSTVTITSQTYNSTTTTILPQLQQPCNLNSVISLYCSNGNSTLIQQHSNYNSAATTTACQPQQCSSPNVAHTYITETTVTQ